MTAEGSDGLAAPGQHADRGGARAGGKPGLGVALELAQGPPRAVIPAGRVGELRLAPDVVGGLALIGALETPDRVENVAVEPGQDLGRVLVIHPAQRAPSAAARVWAGRPAGSPPGVMGVARGHRIDGPRR